MPETQTRTAREEGLTISGKLGRVKVVTNEHGTFYTALIEWMGGRAFVDMARDEGPKLEGREGQPVVLDVAVRPYVRKDGGPGFSFNYGRVLG